MTYDEWQADFEKRYAEAQQNQMMVNNNNNISSIFANLKKTWPGYDEYFDKAANSYNQAITKSSMYSYTNDVDSMFFSAISNLKLRRPDNAKLESAYNNFINMNSNPNLNNDEFAFSQSMDENQLIGMILDMTTHRISDLVNNGYFQLPEELQGINLESGHYKELVDYVLKNNPNNIILNGKDAIDEVINMAEQKGFFNANTKMQNLDNEQKSVGIMVNNEQTYRGLMNLSDEDTLDLYNNYRRNLGQQGYSLDQINTQFPDNLTRDEMLAKLGQVSMDPFALKYKSGALANVQNESTEYAKIAETYSGEGLTMDELYQRMGVESLNRGGR